MAPLKGIFPRATEIEGTAPRRAWPHSAAHRAGRAFHGGRGERGARHYPRILQLPQCVDLVLPSTRPGAVPLVHECRYRWVSYAMLMQTRRRQARSTCLCESVHDAQPADLAGRGSRCFPRRPARTPRDRPTLLL